MQQMKLVLFDLDGTLFRTESVDVAAFNRALEAHGRKPQSKERILSLVGLILEDFCKELLGTEDEKLLQCFKEDVKKFEEEEVKASGELYPKIPEFLQRLKSHGHTLCICSNGNEEYVAAICSKFGFDKIFEEIWYSKEGITKSQAVGILKKKFHADRFVMVGDRMCDFEAARDHEGISIGVTYGYGGTEPEFADFIADSVDEVEQILLQIMR